MPRHHMLSMLVLPCRLGQYDVLSACIFKMSLQLLNGRQVKWKSLGSIFWLVILFIFHIAPDLIAIAGIAAFSHNLLVRQ
jgi:hypothetical protein